MQQLAPPNDPTTEQALIGSILMDPEQLLALDLTPDDFFLDRHKTIYQTMLRFFSENKGIDFVTLAAELPKDCGAAYLTGCINHVGMGFNAPTYAERISDLAFRRKLLSISGTIAEIAYNSRDLDRDQMEGESHKALLGLNGHNRVKDGLTLDDAICEFLPELNDYLEGTRQTWGLPTGLPDLDSYLGGLPYGEMTLIAADPAQGKTTLGMTIAFNAASKGNPGIVFSLEMTRRQMMLRFFAERADTSTSTIRRGELNPVQVSNMWESVNRVSKIPLWIYDQPKNSGALQRDIMRLDRQLQAEGKQLKFAVIDYSDLLTDRGENEVVRQKNLSHNLKLIAKRTGVALIVVHTITRDAKLQDQPPQLHHLGWGRAWEFDAHTVLFPYFAHDRTDFSAVILPGKYRDGIAGKKIPMLFDGKRWAGITKEPR